MENAADALKISFAVFIFIIAIAITFSVISKAKTTSDVVLYHTDKSNFYEHVESKQSNRAVSWAEVVSTLYKSSEESIEVSIIDDYGNTLCNFSSASEEVINNFVNEKEENTDLETKKFVEEFIEVPYEGIYKTGEDGSQIVVADGQKKVFIKYYTTKYYKENIDYNYIEN